MDRGIMVNKENEISINKTVFAEKKEPFKSVYQEVKKKKVKTRTLSYQKSYSSFGQSE